MPKAASRPVLDTVVLRVMAFAHTSGLDILLATLGVTKARFPAEVYAWDENQLPLTETDAGLSELARGIRYAQRQLQSLPPPRAQRYRTWLENAHQLPRHHARGSLIMDPLQLKELPRREELIQRYGIGSGEAACLVLAERYGSTAIFLSSDTAACRVATELGIDFLTLPDVLETWVTEQQPSVTELDVLTTGMRNAKFSLAESELTALKQRLQEQQQ